MVPKISDTEDDAASVHDVVPEFVWKQAEAATGHSMSLSDRTTNRTSISHLGSIEEGDDRASANDGVEIELTQSTGLSSVSQSADNGGSLSRNFERIEEDRHKEATSTQL